MSLVLIATTTVGAGGAATIDFNSIPQTYSDLMVVLSLRMVGNPESSVGASVFMNFNGDYGVNYAHRHLTGDSTTAYSGSGTGQFVGWAASSATTANTFSNCSIIIPNYVGSSAKTGSVEHVLENNAANNRASIVAYRWSGTSAINTISFGNGSTNFAQYSTASLYGIQKDNGYATVA